MCAYPVCVCVCLVRCSRLHASERSKGLAAESQGLRRQEIKHEMKTSSSLNILPSHFPISPLPLSDLKEEEGGGERQGERFGGRERVAENRREETELQQWGGSMTKRLRWVKEWTWGYLDPLQLRLKTDRNVFCERKSSSEIHYTWKIKKCHNFLKARTIPWIRYVLINPIRTLCVVSYIWRPVMLWAQITQDNQRKDMTNLQQ